MIYVYILLCSDGTFYTGITKNIDARIEQHNSGQSISTRKKLPVKLVFDTLENDYQAARKLEVHIKKTGAAKWLLKEKKMYIVKKSGLAHFISFN